MKRVVSIPLLLMILFSGLSVQIASHYCKGNFSGSKVSLNGQLASCGMEDLSGAISSEDQISNHCCDDIISSLSFSPDFISSSCHDLPDPRQEIYHLSVIQNELPVIQDFSISLTTSKNRPPGTFNPDGIEQQDLCIFRI
jgi:hypothetical protein